MCQRNLVAPPPHCTCPDPLSRKPRCLDPTNLVPAPDVKSLNPSRSCAPVYGTARSAGAVIGVRPAADPRRTAPPPYPGPRHSSSSGASPTSAVWRQEQPGLAAAGSGTPPIVRPSSLGGLFTPLGRAAEPPPSVPRDPGGFSFPVEAAGWGARAPRRRHRPDSPADAAADAQPRTDRFGMKRMCRSGR
jgi:hypothetical protein